MLTNWARKHAKTMQWLARFGYSGRGLVYVAVGALACAAALSERRRRSAPRRPLNARHRVCRALAVLDDIVSAALMDLSASARSFAASRGASCHSAAPGRWQRSASTG